MTKFKTIGAVLPFFPTQLMLSITAEQEGVFMEKTGAMEKYIPEEIFLNILPNLPEQSLLRFRCVSKLWCSSISQIKTHRHKFITKSDLSNGFDDKILVQSIDETTGSVEDIKDLPWEAHKIQIYGSCNGLVLIGYEGDLFLWNPTLGCHKKFFSYGRLASTESYSYDSSSIVGGLCFDSANNEYKIVMAIRNKNLNRNALYVVVGSPRNRTWTPIGFPYSVQYIYPGPVFNNRLHWTASNLFIYFDTNTDEFVELPLPRPRVDCWRNGVCGLGVLDGLLCMARYDGYMSNTIEILGMLEYGVKESWSTIFRIKGFDPMYGIVPLFCLENDKNKVFVKARENCRDYIFMYDTVAELHTDIIRTQREYVVLGVVYEKTLIRPTGYGWEELDSRGEATYVEGVSSNHTVTMKRDGRRVWRIVNHHWEQSSEDKEIPVSKSTSRRPSRSDPAAGRGSFWSKEKCPW